MKTTTKLFLTTLLTLTTFASCTGGFGDSSSSSSTGDSSSESTSVVESIETEALVGLYKLNEMIVYSYTEEGKTETERYSQVALDNKKPLNASKGTNSFVLNLEANYTFLCIDDVYLDYGFYGEWEREDNKVVLTTSRKECVGMRDGDPVYEDKVVEYTLEIMDNALVLTDDRVVREVEYVLRKTAIDTQDAYQPYQGTYTFESFGTTLKYDTLAETTHIQVNDPHPLSGVYTEATIVLHLSADGYAYAISDIMLGFPEGRFLTWKLVDGKIVLEAYLDNELPNMLLIGWQIEYDNGQLVMRYEDDEISGQLILNKK